MHGVFTNSNVRTVIETMAKKGFDNQPVYCRKRHECIGAIRLKEALENLFHGNYNEFETFENYDKMIEKGLMLHPPPVFLLHRSSGIYRIAVQCRMRSNPLQIRSIALDAIQW